MNVCVCGSDGNGSTVNTWIFMYGVLVSAERVGHFRNKVWITHACLDGEYCALKLVFLLKIQF